MASNLKVPFDLYLITDRGVVGSRDLISLVEDALKGGVRAIQLREKDMEAGELFELAQKLRELTAKYDAQLLINDRVDIALLVGADGVHLARTSMTVKDARELMGKEKLIGVSCHSVEEVEEAQADGADFVTIGPIYDTPSKRQYGVPVGTSLLNKVKGSSMKKFALGGVKLHSHDGIDRIAECINGGADGIALISGILASKDVEQTAKEYIKKINEIKNN